MARLTSASYAKIALIVVLALALFGIAGFGSCASARWSGGMAFTGEAYRGSAEVEASAIKNINIKWAAGTVDIKTKEGGATIDLIETANGGLARAQEMQWQVSGDTLNIDYGAGFSCFSVTSKKVEVVIPKNLAASLGAVSIDGASGTYLANGLSCQAFTMKLASGGFSATNMVTKDLRLDTASGNASFDGSVTGAITTKTASGKIDISTSTMPTKIDSDLASGTVVVAIPENEGYSVTLQKASGTYKSEFSTTNQGNDAYVYKNGGVPITIKMASGDFELRKTT